MFSKKFIIVLSTHKTHPPIVIVIMVRRRALINTRFKLCRPDTRLRRTYKSTVLILFPQFQLHFERPNLQNSPLEASPSQNSNFIISTIEFHKNSKKSEVSKFPLFPQIPRKQVQWFNRGSVKHKEQRVIVG